MRYLRAFFKALTLTLQGRAVQPVAETYPSLQVWLDRGIQLVDVAFAAAQAQGFDKEARQAFKITIDRRPWSAEVILSAVRYHFTMEYPSLLQSNLEHSITTLYALNLDDQYRVTQLAEADQLPAELRSPIAQLADHLGAIPPSNQP